MAFLALLAGTVQAGIPLMNVTCGSGIEVHADAGGPVYIDGKEAKLKKFNDNYYEASRQHTTISISINPDGTASASYTGAHGANGICQAQDFSNIGASSADTRPAGSKGMPIPAEQACLRDVTRTTNNGDVVMLSSSFSQAGTEVIVGVGPQRARWRCIGYEDGSTDGIMSLTNEGGL